jgi:hypothetical protein
MPHWCSGPHQTSLIPRNFNNPSAVGSPTFTLILLASVSIEFHNSFKQHGDVGKISNVLFPSVFGCMLQKKQSRYLLVEIS